MILVAGVSVDDVCQINETRKIVPLENSVIDFYLNSRVLSVILEFNPRLDIILSNGENFCAVYGESNETLKRYIQWKGFLATKWCLHQLQGVWPDLWWQFQNYIC